MKLEYYDEIDFCYKTANVVENIKKINPISFLFSKGLGKKLKKCFQQNSYDFVKALKRNILKNDIRFFSNKAQPIISQIHSENSCDGLKNREWVILYADIIMPIAYGETEINITDMFLYTWIILSCRLLWDSLDAILKEELWKLCYRKERVFEDILLEESEQIEKTLLDHPETKNFRFPQPNAAEEQLRGLTQLKEVLPHRVYGYLIRNFYKADTAELSTELLREAFDGILPEDTMFKEELVEFNNLPSTLTVYRGTGHNETIFRPSWTLNKTRAQKFNHGKFLKATINKNRVIAYWSDEEEIIAWIDQSDLS